jgi:hypothetical protein
MTPPHTRPLPFAVSLYLGAWQDPSEISECCRLPVKLLLRNGEVAECGHCAGEAGERLPQLWFSCETEASRSDLSLGLTTRTMSTDAKMTIAIAETLTIAIKVCWIVLW